MTMHAADMGDRLGTATPADRYHRRFQVRPGFFRDFGATIIPGAE